MIRTVLYALLGIFLVTVVRMFINVIGKAISEQAFGTEKPSPDPESPSQKSSTQASGGELKKCIVCGAYSPTISAPKIKGSDAFICSENCAAKYHS